MKKIVFLILLTFSVLARAQDKALARTIIDSLTSDYFSGRGYVNNGHLKAANFIARQFNNWGLSKFDSDYKQEFTMSANTFEGTTELQVDGKVMVAGVDFLAAPNCPSIRGQFKLKWLNPKIVGNAKKMSKFLKEDLKDYFLIVDKTGVSDETKIEFLNNMVNNPFGAKGIIMVETNKFTWGTARNQKPYPVISVLKSRISYRNKRISINIEAKVKRDLVSQNVIGYVKGTEHPDSFLVFSAHYDHLGMFGPDAVFCGANDNASGTAMLMNLAYHYSQNPPKYSIMFIAFGGEEAGLLGSKHYVNHPYFSLKKIKLLVNLDIMGTGDDGIKMVNGSVYRDVLNKFRSINTEKSYLTQVYSRGEAANSDHYWFHKKGVKSVFVYTLGGSKAYHDVYDTADNLTLSKYNEVFKLILDFVDLYK